MMRKKCGQSKTYKVYKKKALWIFTYFCLEATRYNEKFLLAPMGVLAPRLRTLVMSARPPINMSENFPTHMSAESPLNIFPNL
jgi:hypothetical protein